MTGEEHPADGNLHPQQRKIEEADPKVREQCDRKRAIARGEVVESRKHVDWDKTPLPPEHHRAIRAAVLRLIKRYVAICYSDLRMEEWFETDCHIYTSLQWTREIDQNLVRNKPQSWDGVKLRSFKVAPGPKATIWLCRRDQLHCGVKVAAERESVDDPVWVHGLLEQLRASADTCTRCHPPPEADQGIGGRPVSETQLLDTPPTAVGAPAEAKGGDEDSVSYLQLVPDNRGRISSATGSPAHPWSGTACATTGPRRDSWARGGSLGVDPAPCPVPLPRRMGRIPAGNVRCIIPSEAVSLGAHGERCP